MQECSCCICSRHFNRTKVECKYESGSSYNCEGCHFNRTKVECKSIFEGCTYALRVTLIELK